MKINYIAYYMQYDGYGRFNSRLVNALLQEGVEVKAAQMGHLEMPRWMQQREGLDWSELTISCLPPYYLKPVPGRHWLLSMTEGSIITQEWVETINNSGVERVIVPCEHNRKAFIDSGVIVPVSVILGGTDPLEFPRVNKYRTPESISEENPYTFLTIADRGFRKGWDEVREAFYIAFGGKTTGKKDVRLIIKCRPTNTHSLISIMNSAVDKDTRVIYQIEDSVDIYNIYNQADVVALPSRSEGWGMPHREAAMMGIPVITQVYSGMDDGHTEKWALTLRNGLVQPIPKESNIQLGEWMVADLGELAQIMKWARYSPETAAGFGQLASRWLVENQTWQHSAQKLITLIEGREDGLHMARTTLSLAL